MQDTRHHIFISMDTATIYEQCKLETRILNAWKYDVDASVKQKFCLTCKGDGLWYHAREEKWQTKTKAQMLYLFSTVISPILRADEAFMASAERRELSILLSKKSTYAPAFTLICAEFQKKKPGSRKRKMKEVVPARKRLVVFYTEEETKTKELTKKEFLERTATLKGIPPPFSVWSDEQKLFWARAFRTFSDEKAFQAWTHSSDAVVLFNAAKEDVLYFDECEGSEDPSWLFYMDMHAGTFFNGCSDPAYALWLASETDASVIRRVKLQHEIDFLLRRCITADQYRDATLACLTRLRALRQAVAPPS